MSHNVVWGVGISVDIVWPLSRFHNFIRMQYYLIGDYSIQQSFSGTAKIGLLGSI